MERKPISPDLVMRISQGTSQPFIVNGVTPLGWFGPQQPIQPLAQDIPGVAGRQFDYRAGINVNIQPKVQEGSGVSYPQLRQLADSLDILRLVIETRKDQMESLSWTIEAKKDKKVSEETLASITAVLRQPTVEYDWGQWLRMLLEDMFVLDAVAIYPRMTRGGSLYSLDLVDAATIKRVIDDGGRTPIAPDPAYQQILKGVPAVDYSTEELIFRMRNPRTSRMYGYSPVEQIIMTVNIALRRQMTQLQYFTEGNIPEAFASVPDTWSPDQVGHFQLYFDSLMQGNTASRSRLKFLPLDTGKIKETKDPMLKDAFDEWLARIVCYCFSVPAAPFIKDQNRATAVSAREAATEEGLFPLMNWVKRTMDFIIATRMGNLDVEFVWEQNDAMDPMVQASIDKIYAESGIRQVNEIRADRGWGPLDEPEKEEPVAPEPVAAPEPVEKEPMVTEKMHLAVIDSMAKMNEAIKEQGTAAAGMMAKAMDKPASDIHVTMPDIHLGNTIVHMPEQAPVTVDVGGVTVHNDITKASKTVTVSRQPDGSLHGVINQGE